MRTEINKIVFFEYSETPKYLLKTLFGSSTFTDDELVELFFGSDKTIWDNQNTAYYLEQIGNTLYVIASDYLSAYEQRSLYDWWLSNL